MSECSSLPGSNLRPMSSLKRPELRRRRRLDPLLLIWAALALAIVAVEAWVVLHGAPPDPFAPYYVS